MARKKPARKKPSSEKPAEEKEDKKEAAETTPAGKKPRAEKRALSSNDGSSSGDKKKKKSKQNYKPLILDALKEVYPGGISRRSLTFLNDYANDFIEKVWQEADRIAEENSIDIITPRELDAAVYRILPEDFAKGVVSQANRTYAKFLSDANQSGDGHEVAIQSGNPLDVAEV